MKGKTKSQKILDAALLAVKNYEEKRPIHEIANETMKLAYKEYGIVRDKK